MEISGYQLSLSQKTRLALNVFLIYWPIRQYVGKDRFDWELIQRDWLIWIFELVVTVAWFTFFLIATEWLEKRFVKNFRFDFSQEMKFPAQLATLALAAMLAVAFNAGYFSIFRMLRMPIHAEETVSIRQFATNRLVVRNPVTNRFAKVNNALTIMAMLAAFYLAANKRKQQQIEDLRVASERLKLQATQAQLVALQNQINPHFLFNSLSILSSLVEADPKLSVRFINKMAASFRYILENGNVEKVSLQAELDFLNSYIFLLNIRFDGKLKAEIDVPETVSYHRYIAPLTLQLLVENVVKHNQMSVEKPLTATVFTQNEYLIIRNPRQLRPDTSSSTGVGLQNIQNRYSLLTDKKVVINQTEDIFEVQIPLLS